MSLLMYSLWSRKKFPVALNAEILVLVHYWVRVTCHLLSAPATVLRYIVRLAPYQRGYCEARVRFISTWVYFHVFYFLQRVGNKLNGQQ
jgi:hypothetical protein